MDLKGVVSITEASYDSWLVYNKGCVHTNRVESSPIQSSQTHKDAAGPLWLTYNGSRCGAYTPAESSQVKSRESCRVKSLDAACSIFVSQTLVFGCDGCCLGE